MKKNHLVLVVSLVVPAAGFFASAYSQSADNKHLKPHTAAPQPKAESQAGATANQKLSQPTIWQAVQKGKLSEVQKLIRSNPKLANAIDPLDNRPLNLAVWGGRWEMIKYLVSKGADVNGADGRGATPLHAAIAWDAFPKGRLEIVKYLVSQGADVHYRFTYGDTLLHFAKDAQVAQYLIGKGVPVNIRNNSHGLTPLHKATYWLKESHSPAQTRSLLQLIRVLIANGADIEVKDKMGKTLIDDAKQIASAELRQQVMELLLQTDKKK